MANEVTENQQQNVTGTDAILATVDAVTRSRIGGLSAHGLSDHQIADMLLLKIEQVLAARNSQEFKAKYAQVADEEIQKQLDLADGWDAVEERAIASVLETLAYNKDPRYTLAAAKIANSAHRRKPNANPNVINASNVTNNIIVLNLNRSYVKKSTESESGMIDVTPRPGKVERKVSDLPSPKDVENLLAPVKQLEQKRMLTELEQQFEIAGVFKDDNPA